MARAREADVAVVGAGFAGLAAARKVAAAGRSVVVLEARDRVGGRTLNASIGGDAIVEMGGQWVGPTQDRMYALARELDVDTFSTYDDGERIVFINGKRYRYRGDYPTRMNPAILADFGQAFYRFERMAKKVPPDEPWRARRAVAWDSQTFETWMRRAMRTKTARLLWRFTIEGVFATEPANLSLLHALFYAASGTNMQNLIAVTAGAQQDRFVGGSQVLAVKMGEGLGESVVLNAPVWRIEQEGNSVLLSADGVLVRARRVIVSVPPALAARIDYRPLLPAARDQLTQRMPHGSVIKVNVVYDEPFWRGEGLSGQAFDAELPFSTVFDNSPPSGSPGVLVGFIEGEHAVRWGRRSEDERRQEVLRCLRRYFGPRAASPEQYLERDWSAEEWTRGCYGAHMPPGVWTQFGPALREPVGLVHWAGTETARRWAGYMDGALESGERAADEVMEALA